MMGRPMWVEEADGTTTMTTRDVKVGMRTWNDSEVHDISPEFHGYVMVFWGGNTPPFSIGMDEKWSIKTSSIG